MKSGGAGGAKFPRASIWGYRVLLLGNAVIPRENCLGTGEAKFPVTHCDTSRFLQYARHASIVAPPPKSSILHCTVIAPPTYHVTYIYEEGIVGVRVYYTDVTPQTLLV